jgi:pimeloyl-ACP methyl ester carboxylesterase
LTGWSPKSTQVAADLGRSTQFDAVAIPAAGTAPPRTPIAGMHFTETMRGNLTATAAADDGAREGSDDLKASFRVTISSPDLDKFLVDPAHGAAADGTVWVQGYTGPDGKPIIGGLFNLFTDAGWLYRRNMQYSLPFHGQNGGHYILQGHKDVWDHGNFDVWGSTTTLYTTLIDADHPSRPSLATGVLKLSLPMFARQMTTMRITGPGNRLSRLGSLSAFGQFFATTLFDVFVRARLDARTRAGFAMSKGDKVQTDQRHDLTVADQAPVTLTRVKGGPKGPVLLVHGVAVSSQIFALPTVRQNFVQFLAGQGYDVWLLDWRGSIIHPLRQFTLDEAARLDLPAAVRKIQSVTKASSLQAVAHCAGSIVLFMAMSKGLLPSVRCVVASQVALHHNVAPAAAFKARVHLADHLASAGATCLSPADDDGHPLFQFAFGRFTDAFHHECSSTFCHRLTFTYGHLYHHARLNCATHDALASQFGRCNILALRHFSQLVSAGYARMFDFGPKRNADIYDSPKPPDYLNPAPLKVPITFVSGRLNKTWLPESTERTFDWLVSANGPSLYRRHVIDGYGHLDTFMGATANTDTYPVMLYQLERCC